MSFDGITIAALRSELARNLTGARITKIIQPEKDALILTMKAASGQKRLLISANGGLPLIYLTKNNRPAPAQAPGFCMLLRKHMGGGRIVSVTQPGLERILRFEIEHLDEMGDLCRKVLTVELMGKHSNIIFLDDQDQIIDSIKHISLQTSSVREVLPGRSYFIPNTEGKSDPFTVTGEEFREHVFKKPVNLGKALYTSLTGISPVIADELCHRAGLDSSMSTASFGEMEQIHLYSIFRMMMEDVQQEQFTPVLVTDGSGKPVEYAALDLTMYHDLNRQSFESVSTLLEDFYAMKDRVSRIRQRSADLRHIVSVATDRVSRKLDLQEKQLKDTEKRDKYRIWGELLNTYGYSSPPGAKSITVTNYYDGTQMEIPLDPTMTAQENAARYFDRYAKQKRTAQALDEQTRQTREDLEQLLSIRTFLDMTLEEEDLVQVRDELAQAGYIKRRSSEKKAKVVSRPYHYLSRDGCDIYVGKNNYQNDELTFKFASAKDWWFHAKKMPGSHVILHCGGAMPSDGAFEDAARLAAYYSAGRDAEKVEIDYVQRREVKKPAGAKPGFVVYYTNYSMVIDTDISALKQV